MRVLAMIAVVGAMVGAIACNDVTPPSTLPAYRLFVSRSVDHNVVPTIISAGLGDTTHMVWSTVSLDLAGRAVTVRHLSSTYLLSTYRANLRLAAGVSHEGR
jgi:hypothetical protein